MAKSDQLWLYHPRPLPDELLSSWLVRIAHGHDMKLQTFCRVSLGKGQEIWARDIDRQAPDWLVKLLSVHTGVSVQEVWSCSLLAYKGLLYREYRWSGQQFWLLPLKIAATSYHHHGMQFCAKCLAEDEIPYFRKRWRVAFYTMCTKHQCMLHDRCPSCDAPVMFHRGEMGKFSQVESGSITLCHACGLDLRESPSNVPVIYNQSAYQIWLPAMQMLEDHRYGDAQYDVGFFAVLHQLCKIMLTHYSHVQLRKYVSEKICAPVITLRQTKNSFEFYSLAERHIVIQLAMWLLADPEARILDAWRNKAVRYNVLKKDFEKMPEWYKNIVGKCSDWRNDPFAAIRGCK
jgi:hypothetical protein